MLVFTASFLMVLISSYLLGSAFAPKKYALPIVYMFLISFAQIVLSFEILSVFSKIGVPGLIICNVLFLIISVFVWNKKGRQVYVPDIKTTVCRIFNACKRDKYLAFMGIGFLFFIAVTIFLCAVLPVNSYDALNYHLSRVPFWLSQGNLNHFDIADDRSLIMPINSELLYVWVLLFFKSDWGLGFTSFIGYGISVITLYNLLAFFGFSERKKLWSIFIYSSLSCIIAEASSIETDVLLGSLVLAGMFIYIFAIKEKRLSPIYFASLAFALAFGTKTPALIAFPACFVVLWYFSYKYCRKESYKPLLTFLFFLLVNFLVFSSYNYFLNYIQYGNFFTSPASDIVHSFWGGPKAYIANFIRYIFLMFDFSGFRYSEYVGPLIILTKSAIFEILNIPLNLGVRAADLSPVNNMLLDVTMGPGLLGFILFLPAAVRGIIYPFKRNKNKKLLNLVPFAFLFWSCIAIMSGVLAYMVFSVRFLTFFIVISSPILAFTYIKKSGFFKFIILFFSLSYLMIISTHIYSRSLPEFVKLYKKTNDIHTTRDTVRCAIYIGYGGKIPFCYLRDTINKMPVNTKIGIFSATNSRLYPVKMLYKYGYTIDSLLIEKIDKYDLKKYDYLIFTDPNQYSSVIVHPERAMTDYVLTGNHIDFISPRPNRCVYVGENKVPVNKNNPKTPVYAICNVEQQYLNSQGFVLEKIVKYEAVSREDSNTMSFYKNIGK